MYEGSVPKLLSQIVLQVDDSENIHLVPLVVGPSLRVLQETLTVSGEIQHGCPVGILIELLQMFSIVQFLGR